jgi:hypothetical protein
MVGVGIFDESSAEYIDEFKALADAYVISFAELLEM